jgi:hypothetical protein
VREAVWRGEDGLSNLAFWGIETALWRHEVKKPSAATRSLLAKACVTHGDWLDRAGRRPEMQPLTTNVRKYLLPAGHIPAGEDWWMGAVLHQVRIWRTMADLPSEQEKADDLSRQLLLHHLGAVSGVQLCALLRDLAEISADQGHFDMALGYIHEAHLEAQRTGDEGSAGVLAHKVKAGILERAGERNRDSRLLGQALDTIPAVEDAGDDPSQQAGLTIARAGLTIARAGLLYKNGSPADASEYLTHAYALIHRYGYPHLLPAADALAENLG